MTNPELVWKIMPEEVISVDLENTRLQGEALARVVMFELERCVKDSSMHYAQRVAARLLEGSGWQAIFKFDPIDGNKFTIKLTPVNDPITLKLKI